MVETTTGGYLELTLDNTYLKSVNVPAASIITGTSQRDNGDGTVTVRIDLQEINATTAASFPFNVFFKESLTPDGYTLHPRVTLHRADGTPIAHGTGDAAMSVKYDEPEMFKYVISNSNQAFANDGRQVYAGGAENGAIADPVDVTFMYRTRTTVPRDPYSYPPGRYKLRALDRIVVTDTLPTYTDAAGNQVRAAFDPARNPGWVDNGDGTVSYTLENGSPDLLKDNVEADLADLKLRLSFPGARVGSIQTNTVGGEFRPLDQQPGEPTYTARDSIDFKLSDGYFGSGPLSKSTNSGWTFGMDLGANYESSTTYSVLLTNTSPYPMRNIVITDDRFDSRLYIHSIFGLNVAGGRDSVEAVFGIEADGTRVPVAAPDREVFDSRAYESIMAQVARVRAGELDPADTVKADQRFVGLEVKMKPYFVLEPGQSISVFPTMRLNDPYHTAPSAEAAQNRYTNTARGSGTLVVGETEVDFSNEASATVTAAAKQESTSIAKTTMGNASGSIGERLSFRIAWSAADISKGRVLRNLTFTDVLPRGLTWAGTGTWTWSQSFKDKIERIDRIEDYRGSGREAIVIRFKDQGTDDNPLGTGMTFDLTGFTITGDMIPSSAETPEFNNDNRVYLTADGWDPVPEGVKTQTLLPDTYDVDGDGDTADQVLGASSKIIANLPFEVRSEKLISADGRSFGDGPLDVAYGAGFTYRLANYNFSQAPLDKFEIVDPLPAFSQEAGRVRLAGPVSAPEDFTVLYRTAPLYGRTVDDVRRAAADTASWVTADRIDDWGSVTAIKAVLKEGKRFMQGSSALFDVPVEAPGYRDATQAGALARNSFFRSVDGGASFGETGAVDARLMTRVSVEKRWIGPAAGPVEVKVHRVAEGEQPDGGEVAGLPVVATLVLDAGNRWAGQVDLPSYDDAGHRVSYAVSEPSVPDGYEVSVAGSVADGFTVTNTSNAETSVSVSKAWDDDSDRDGIRPASVEVGLLADGRDTGKALTLDASSGWSGSFDGLRVYDVDDGHEIAYTVAERGAPAGYAARVTGDAASGFTVTNRHRPETVDIAAHKVWDDADDADGIRPDSVRLQLMADGTPVGNPVEVTADDGWSHTFENLPRREAGAEIAYTVEELDVPEGYAAEVSGDATSGFTVTNAHDPETVDVSARKVWDDDSDRAGVRPDSVTLQLMADGEPVGDPVEVTADGGWAHTWAGLHRNAAGRGISYAVEEVGVPEGYAASVTGDMSAGFTVTNTLGSKPAVPGGSTGQPGGADPRGKGGRALPRTGDGAAIAPLSLAGASVAMLVAAALRRRLR